MSYQIYIIFITLLGITVLINIGFYAILFSKFAFHKAKKEKQSPQEPVSIIVVAKNEAHHLINSLPLLLTQQYNDYEVIVVNDNSDDETEEVLEDFKNRYPHLKPINLKSSVTTIKGKKFPLSLGIRVAKNNIIILTEPYCIQVSPYWLQNMAKHYNRKTEIVLGFANYEKKKSLFNAILRFDALYKTIQNFSYALMKIPIAGDGKNLSYSKELFINHGGFTAHNHIFFGDDDLFINKAATKENCKIEYSKDAIITVKSKFNFKFWLRQEKLKSLTRKFYSNKHKFLLTLFESSSLLFYIFLTIALIFLPSLSLTWIIPLLVFFILRFAIQYLIVGLSVSKLGEKKFIPYIFVYDIVYLFLYSYILLTAKWGKNNRKKWM